MKLKNQALNSSSVEKNEAQETRQSPMKSRCVEILAGIVFHAEISHFSVFQKMRFVTKSNERCCKKNKNEVESTGQTGYFSENSLTL